MGGSCSTACWRARRASSASTRVVGVGSSIAPVIGAQRVVKDPGPSDDYWYEVLAPRPAARARPAQAGEVKSSNHRSQTEVKP